MVMRMKTMMTNGITNIFEKAYNSQIEFQQRVTGVDCPGDNLNQFQYQLAAMIEELGEVVKADKRWKTHRNTRYNVYEKIDEIADVFIVAMNIAIHSGLEAKDVEGAILNKIHENIRRLEEVKKNASNN